MGSTTVTREALEARIIEAVIELGAERDDIAADATLESLDIDSLDLVEVGQIIEDEFGIVIRGDDVKDVVTFGEVIDAILAKAESEP